MTMLSTISAAPSAAGRLWKTLARMFPPPRSRQLPAVAVKLDERLLADIGLTEQDVLGVEGRYWREWERSQRSWNL